jgi:hypothetical protein
MRSGSTLLTHLLTNHQSANGYAETGLTYSTPEDFKKLAPTICRYLHRVYLPEPILVDQVNHNRQLSDEAVLGLDRAVIISRNESDAIKSLMKTFKLSEEQAREYYTGRVARLKECAKLLGTRAISITYENLVQQPEKTLAILTEFLQFNPPLSAEYKTKRTTGRVSDNSPLLRSGRIQPRAADQLFQ